VSALLAFAGTPNLLSDRMPIRSRMPWHRRVFRVEALFDYLRFSDEMLAGFNDAIEKDKPLRGWAMGVSYLAHARVCLEVVRQLIDGALESYEADDGVFDKLASVRKKNTKWIKKLIDDRNFIAAHPTQKNSRHYSISKKLEIKSGKLIFGELVNIDDVRQRIAKNQQFVEFEPRVIHKQLCDYIVAIVPLIEQCWGKPVSESHKVL
jgi:hypothetical protein